MKQHKKVKGAVGIASAFAVSTVMAFSAAAPVFAENSLGKFDPEPTDQTVTRGETAVFQAGEPVLNTGTIVSSSFQWYQVGVERTLTPNTSNGCPVLQADGSYSSSSDGCMMNFSSDTGGKSVDIKFYATIGGSTPCSGDVSVLVPSGMSGFISVRCDSNNAASAVWTPIAPSANNLLSFSVSTSAYGGSPTTPPLNVRNVRFYDCPIIDGEQGRTLSIGPDSEYYVDGAKFMLVADISAQYGGYGFIESDHVTLTIVDPITPEVPGTGGEDNTPGVPNTGLETFLDGAKSNSLVGLLAAVILAVSAFAFRKALRSRR